MVQYHIYMKGDGDSRVVKDNFAPLSTELSLVYFRKYSNIILWQHTIRDTKSKKSTFERLLIYQRHSLQ